MFFFRWKPFLTVLKCGLRGNKQNFLPLAQVPFQNTHFFGCSFTLQVQIQVTVSILHNRDVIKRVSSPCFQSINVDAANSPFAALRQFPESSSKRDSNSFSATRRRFSHRLLRKQKNRCPWDLTQIFAASYVRYLSYQFVPQERAWLLRTWTLDTRLTPGQTHTHTPLHDSEENINHGINTVLERGIKCRSQNAKPLSHSFFIYYNEKQQNRFRHTLKFIWSQHSW